MDNIHVLDKILKLLTNGNEEVIGKVKKLEAYTQLVEKGVPYEIYLRVWAEGEAKWDNKQCFLRLLQSPYKEDIYLKLCLKEVVDYSKKLMNVGTDYRYGGYKNVVAEKKSVSKKAADAAEVEIRNILNQEQYQELVGYAKGCLPYSYDIQTVQKKAKEYIYEVVNLKGFIELTYNPHGIGNQTSASMVLGIPFEMK